MANMNRQEILRLIRLKYHAQDGPESHRTRMEDNHKVVDHWKANIRPKLDSILQMRWSALGLLLLIQIEVCEIVRSKSGCILHVI